MKLVATTKKIKCEILGCREKADYFLIDTENNGHGQYYCANCINRLYKAIGEVLVSKSPTNLIKKHLDSTKGKNENGK